MYRALDYPREKDGARVQMRLSYSPAAQFFLFLVQWTDCHLAGSLGLLRVLIYMVLLPLLLVYYIHHVLLLDCLINSLRYVLAQTYADGKTTMSVYERKASIREFYGMCFALHQCKVNNFYVYALLFFCSCYIPVLVATTKGNHRPRRPEAKRGVQHAVQKEGREQKV